MATSGSTDFTLNRDELIKDALILLGAVGADQSVSSEDNNLANRALNRLIKAWQGQGIHLWTETEATVFLIKGQESYALNAASGDHASKTVVETTLSAAEASGQTILSITDTTGMTASDNIGIELDDGTRQWTTISSVDSSTQVTVAAALTGAAASGSSVYSYTTKLARPLDIISVRVKDNGGYETRTRRVGRDDYFTQGDKSAQGKVIQYYYDPQLSTGRLYVWPTSDNVDDRLKITYRRSLEDVDSGTDTFDFPQEWLDALTYNLAVRLAPAFGKQQKLQSLAPLAEKFKQDMLDYDHEKGSVTIIPAE